MSEVITVEAVSSKFKNRYNSGSVLSGGKWMQVDSKIDLGLFQKDSQLNVETQTNDKGYTKIVRVVDGGVTAKRIKEAVNNAREEKAEAKQAAPAKTYEDNKSRRILVQGVVQAAVSGSATINFGNEPKEIAAKVKELALELIAFVDEQSK